MKNPWKQTATGIAFDLLRPRTEMVDFDVDVPESLARQARFSGHVRSGPYSVAQHSVLGADALMRESADINKAAAFLLHDAHEAYIGDIATPVARGLEAYGAEIHPIIGPVVMRESLANMKARIDKAIHAAAELIYPLPEDVARAVRFMDRRMLETERRHLLGAAPAPWPCEGVAPVRLNGRIRIWPWPEAADEFRDRLQRYLPHLPSPRNPAPHNPAHLSGARFKSRRPTLA